MSETIEARLARLERRNVYFGFSVTVITLLIGVIVYLAFTPARSKIQGVLMARGYEVIDEKGGKRATLGLTDKGEPFLSLIGSDNSKNVLISIRQGPFIVLGDVNNNQYLSLFGPAPDSAGVIDFTSVAQSQMELKLGRDGTASLVVRDKEGKATWKAP